MIHHPLCRANAHGSLSARLCHLYPITLARIHIHELDEIFGKQEIKRPVERDTNLLLEARQLAEIDGSPQPPGGKAGKIHTHDARYTGAFADRSQSADRLKPERSLSLTIQSGNNVLGHNSSLTKSMLRSWRAALARRSVWNGCTIPKRPHSRPVFDFKEFVRDEPAALLSAIQQIQKWVRRDAGGPYQQVGLDS